MSDERRQDFLYTPGPETGRGQDKGRLRHEAEALTNVGRLSSRLRSHRHDEEALVRELQKLPRSAWHDARLALFQIFGGPYLNAGVRAVALCERAFGEGAVTFPSERALQDRKAEERVQVRAVADEFQSDLDPDTALPSMAVVGRSTAPTPGVSPPHRTTGPRPEPGTGTAAYAYVREEDVRRVEQGIAWLRGTAKRITTLDASMVVQRVPGLGRAFSTVDGLTGGRVTEAAVAARRWVDRFAGETRVAAASASPARATPREEEIDPAIAGLTPDGGRPLPPEIARRMGEVLGHDFSHVRVHVGSAPSSAARAMEARAVTIGSHIFFADGEYAPGTPEGDKLLVHELTHVVQHDEGRLPRGGGGRVRVSDPAESVEVEARAMEDRAGSSRAAQQSRPQASQAGPQTKARPEGTRAPEMGGQASRGLSSFVGELAGDAIAALVRRVSPGLADLIQQGPGAMLRNAIQPAIGTWVSGMTGGINLGAAAQNLTSSLGAAFSVLQGARAGDARCCETLVSGIQAIREVASAFVNNPAIQAIRSVISRVTDVVSKIARLVLAPVFDVVKDIVGGVWDVVQGIAQTISGWLRAVRDAASSAFDWVAQQLGFPSSGGEGGLVDWLKQKAGEIWNEIKETLRPVMGPLQVIGGVLLALSPFGPMLALIVMVPRVVRAVEWLWAHRNDPNIIRSAHQEMGHTILPQILEAGQSFVGALRTGASWLVGKVTELSTGLLELLGGLTGVPLLGMARSFVQTLSTAAQGLASWGQETLNRAVTWCQETYQKVATFIRPYKEVLCSLGLAIASPPMIPVILAGWAWRWLPDCIKPPIIDLLLDAVLAVLRTIPYLPMLGPLWPSLKNFIIGFLNGFRNRSPEDKIALTNKLAQIISGASPEFLLGFVVGLLKGVWDGIKQPFEAIYLVAQGITTVVEYFRRLSGQQTWQPQTAGAGGGGGGGATQRVDSPQAARPTTSSPPPVSIPSEVTPETIQGAVSGIAGQLTEQERERQAAARTATAAAGPAPQTQAVQGGGGDRVAEMAAVAGEARVAVTELSGPAGVVRENFWEALRELFSGGEGMTLDDLIARLSAVWDAARGALQRAGGQLADMICNFFLQPTAEHALGEGVGYIVGMFAFQALLDYLSAGTWTGAMAVIGGIARFLNWPNAVLGEAMQLLSRLGRYVLDGVRRLGSMIRSAASGALARVMGAFTRIGELLGQIAERILGRAGSAASHADDVAHAGGAVVSHADDAARMGSHVDDAAGAGTHADDVTHADDAARQGSHADDAHPSGAAREALKARELPEALLVARGIAAAADHRVPGVLLASSLNALRSRYRWIDYFRVEPHGVKSSIDMIASVHNVTADHDEPVPSVRNGEFNRWFNNLTPEEFDEIWANPRLRSSIEDRLRHPGGFHEWHMVSRAPTFKRWGITAEQIAEMRTLTNQLRFVNPAGRHGGFGSTTAHNELLGIIDSSLDYATFVRRLQTWAHYRLPGGAASLPPGLRP